MSEPYRWADDLPPLVVDAANTLDESDTPLPDNGWVPIGADSRFEAAVRLLTDLEKRRGLDTVHILLALASEGNLGTDDAVRAIEREAKIKRHNESENPGGGRPSKVDDLADQILSSIAVAEREGYEGEQIRARNQQIRGALLRADISRSTYYRLRDRLREGADIDISEIAPPADVVL